VLSAALAQLDKEREKEPCESLVPLEVGGRRRGVVIEVSSGQCQVDIAGHERLCSLPLRRLLSHSGT